MVPLVNVNVYIKPKAYVNGKWQYILILILKTEVYESMSV